MSPTVLGINAYPFFVVVAVCLGVGTAFLCARRAGLPFSRLFSLQALLVVAALFGAKLYSVSEHGRLSTFWQSAISLEGFRYPGGLLAVVTVLPLVRPLFQLSVAEVADVVAAPIAFAMAIMRIGCFLRGCCFGPVTSLFVGVRFPAHSPAWTEHFLQHLIGIDDPYSLPVHPLEIYFGIWSLVVAFVLLTWWPRRQYVGQVFLSFLVLHEGGKAVLESLRIPYVPSLQLTSGVLALLGAAGIVLLGVLRATQHVSPSRRIVS